MSSPDQKETGLLTVEEVAEMLRASPRTVMRMCKSRMIPHIKMGRLLRFRKTEIERAVQRHTIKAIE